MSYHPPKTSFGNDGSVTLSTRACRAVLEKVGLSEELFFEYYRQSIDEARAQRWANASPAVQELRQTVQEQLAEIARLQQELEKVMALATDPGPAAPAPQPVAPPLRPAPATRLVPPAPAPRR